MAVIDFVRLGNELKNIVGSRRGHVPQRPRAVDTNASGCMQQSTPLALLSREAASQTEEVNDQRVGQECSHD